MKKDVLTLLDGREVTLFPLPHDKAVDEYMVVHNRRNLPFADSEHFAGLRAAYERYKQEIDDKYIAEISDARRLLFDNIMLIYDNRERILTDSRMFLAPMPCAGGLYYGDTAAFEDPALGVYLQWWMTCKEAHPSDDEWVFYFSGSPLSGYNHCGIFGVEGQKESKPCSDFADLYRSFARINKMYRGLSDTCEHYPLREVIERLR